MRNRSSPRPWDLIRSYAERLKRLLSTHSEVAFLTPKGVVCWSSFKPSMLDKQLLERLQKIVSSSPRKPQVIDSAKLLATIPVPRNQEHLAAVLVRLSPKPEESAAGAADRTWRRLRPALCRLAAQLAVSSELEMEAPPVDQGGEELEWLFALEAKLRSNANETAAIEQLLADAVERMHASFGALMLPERRMNFTYASPVLNDAGSVRAYEQARRYLLSYMQRRVAPLVANRPPTAAPGRPAFKIMAIPIARAVDKPVGLVAFCKPESQPDFARPQLYLARHIARMIESILDRAYDHATGLLTRAALEQEAARITAMRKSDETHALVYIDIDHLHVINEAFGFDFGDQAIAHVAKHLQPPSLPPDAACGRIAGDAYLVFLPACDAHQAMQWIRSLQKVIGKLKIGLPPQRVILSVSCGIAALPQTADAFSRAMAAAELACQVAKERGRNRAEVYVDVDDSAMHRQEDILSAMRLRSAIDKDRLRIFAQRIVPLRDPTQTSGVECLVRLVAEDGAIVPPAAFLSAARRYQLAPAIDEWMLKKMLEALQPYASMLFHGEIHVALNISEQSLRDDALPRCLKEQLEKWELIPPQLMFEIAETDAVRNPDRTRLLIRRLRKLGCRFTLDDVGTSADSVAHVKSLRPDRVKIDGRIVRDVLSSPESEVKIRAIVDVADSLRLECIAKHTETDVIARKVSDLGVRYVQGNFLHEAEPLTSLLEALRAEESQQLRQLYKER